MMEVSGLLEPSLKTAERQHFLNVVMGGLAQKQKTLPTSYLYDARGSALFEKITQLDEYYQTRTEIEILKNCTYEWTSSLPQNTTLVEFGSGSSIKTEILLSASTTITSYAAIDVSPTALDGAVKRLTARFPKLKVIPIIGDFKISTLPIEFKSCPRAGFFPGSTIGNLAPDEAQTLLRSFAKLLGPSSRLLIGIDLRKDADRLIAAYNDKRNITAAFNLNLLRRVNRELDGNFDLDSFKHLAKYDEKLSRIEMHLVSQKSQTVSIADKIFSFENGETIHTENSYKYTINDFKKLATQAGWQPEVVWTDADHLFSVHALMAK